MRMSLGHSLATELLEWLGAFHFGLELGQLGLHQLSTIKTPPSAAGTFPRAPKAPVSPTVAIVVSTGQGLHQM